MSHTSSTGPGSCRATAAQRPSPGHGLARLAPAWYWLTAAWIALLAVPAHATHYERIVNANTTWTDTGISVVPGKTYLIHDAVGRWSSNTNNPAAETGPDGLPYDGVGEILADTGRFGDLIGFIGLDPRGVPASDARLFPIGSQPISLGGRSARLWLGFNDKSSTNNGGSVLVQIDIEPPVPTFTDCADIPGIIARWRGELNPRDSVGTNHLVLANTDFHLPDGTFFPSTYYTNGQSCRAFYFNGNGGGAYITPTRELEFEEGEDFTLDSWIKIDTGDFATKGNMVLVDRRSKPFDKFYTNPDGSLVRNANGDPIKEGELSVGYLFSLFREGNEVNGRWLLECQMNTRERFAAGLVNTNHHSSSVLTPTLEDPLLATQRWHHVAVSIKRNATNGGRFYIDGKPVGTFDPTPYQGDLTPLEPVPIRLALHARDFFVYQYKGAMDELGFYRRALSSDEVKQAFEAGLAANCCRNVGLSITNPPLVDVDTPFDARVRLTKTFGKPPVGLIITNDIPPGLRFLSAVPQVGTVTTNLSGQVLWYIGTLGSDETVSLRLQLSASSTNTYVLNSRVGYTGGPDDDANDDAAQSSLESAGKPKCQPIPGLLGWWPGNSSPQDIISTNSGKLTGSVGYEPGMVGSGFQLDGAAGSVRLGDALTFRVQDLTLEAWIRRGSTNRATASGSGGFLFAGDTGGYGFGMLDDGRLMLSQVGLSFVPSSRGVTDADTWHHVAVTKSGTNVVFYLDGNVITRTNLAGRFVFNRPFALGALGGTTRNVFLGGIDELSLYNRPLTEAEIQGIVDAGSVGKCRTGLSVDENPDVAHLYILHYQLDDLSQDRFLFLTDPDKELEMETSTNLVNWVRIKRIANPLGEIRGLINPTNDILFYRIYKQP